jgi:hypothetical protein
MQDDHWRAPPDFAAIQLRASNRDAPLVRVGLLALSSSTCAYQDDGEKQQDFHGEKLHQGRDGCKWIGLRVIAVDWSAIEKLTSGLPLIHA